MTSYSLFEAMYVSRILRIHIRIVFNVAIVKRIQNISFALFIP